ncbi:hypothetical protein J6590_074774 [Homalodisca vitripennis]|nr:hypothetical protein J6590_074774 [Homalodisca vitripennis]
MAMEENKERILKSEFLGKSNHQAKDAAENPDGHRFPSTPSLNREMCLVDKQPETADNDVFSLLRYQGPRRHYRSLRPANYWHVQQAHHCVLPRTILAVHLMNCLDRSKSCRVL